MAFHIFCDTFLTTSFDAIYDAHKTKCESSYELSFTDITSVFSQ